MAQLPTHVQEHINNLANINLYGAREALPANCKLYGTKDEAEAACRACDGAVDATWSLAFDAARAVAKANMPDYNRAWRETWHAAYDEICDTSSDAAYAAALLAVCLMVQNHLDQSILNYVLQRWSIWQAGYGCSGRG